MIGEELPHGSDHAGLVSFERHLLVCGQVERHDLIGRHIAKLTIKLRERLAVAGILIGDKKNLIRLQRQRRRPGADYHAQHHRGDQKPNERAMLAHRGF